MATKVAYDTKQECLELLSRFNKEAKHLHLGLKAQKVVFIEEGSTFIRLKHTSFEEALPLIETKRVCYPILLSADTLKDYITLDVVVSKIREQYVVEFEPAPDMPVKDFLIKQYEEQLYDYIKSVNKKEKRR
jgi:hypothetical protein